MLDVTYLMFDVTRLTQAKNNLIYSLVRGAIKKFAAEKLTLISLINIKSRLPILKNSTLHIKNPPPRLLIS